MLLTQQAVGIKDQVQGWGGVNVQNQEKNLSQFFSVSNIIYPGFDSLTV